MLRGKYIKKGEFLVDINSSRTFERNKSIALKGIVVLLVRNVDKVEGNLAGSCINNELDG